MRASPIRQGDPDGTIKDVLLHEGLGFGGVGHDSPLDLPQTCLSALQTAKFDLGSDTSGDTSLDPGDGDGNVLLVLLQGQLRFCIALLITYIGVGGVHHDGIKLDTLLGQADGKFELLGIGSVVQVDRDGYRGVVSTFHQLSITGGFGKEYSLQVKTVLQERSLTILQGDREQLQDGRRLCALSSADETTGHTPVVTCLRENAVCPVSELSLCWRGQSITQRQYFAEPLE